MSTFKVSRHGCDYNMYYLVPFYTCCYGKTIYLVTCFSQKFSFWAGMILPWKDCMDELENILTQREGKFHQKYLNKIFIEVECPIMK